MKNCLNMSRIGAASLALFLSASFTIAQAQTPTKDAAQNSAPPRFVVLASGEKIPLMSGVEKHVGTVTYLDGPTIIDNRIDSNAILNLESKPLAPKAVEAAPAAAAPAKIAAEVKPAAGRDLNAELKSAKNRYTQANADLAAAKKSKNQTATVTARHDIAAAKDDIDRLNREIATTRKKSAAK